MMFHPQKVFCNKISPLIKKTFSIALPLLYLFFISGCYSPKYQQKKDSFPAGIEKIAVVGFKTALSEDESPNLFRSPISGQTIQAEPVSEKKAEEMTFDLFNLLKTSAKYSLIQPGQARGVYSALLSQDTGISEVDMLKKAGKSFSADAVLFGYIYRCRERVGAEYGIQTPASVAFDLSLVSADNGSVLWRGIFNKTQMSLSENLLDFSTFIKSKGKWLTSRELAQIGLEQLVKELAP
jgi:hypothetical protein